ncbi:hypothetical protein [Thermostichus vulcanus]|uniref:Uncharacterized protein n=1 Tax=Thermostichus vulcanus str. 'Rupite' TaxID=2813851 RepID=A0ABT0C772_THEVL|nr:hypothetical protein [Thermostichus vulcanus]MCJ2541641.1 hypothetical protein [Thermostichus vulcanus str. 'Rupite']
MSVMVAATWAGPGIPSVAEVAQAWVACSRHSYHWLNGDPMGYAPLAQTEAHLRDLWQQISTLNHEGRAEPLLVLRGSLADPIGAGQTWADLARAWNLPVLLTLPRRGAISQAAAFAALVHQARARCLGWVLLGEPGFDRATATGERLGSQPDFPVSSDLEDWEERDSALATHLETQLGIPVLGRRDRRGQITWDTDSLAAMGYI